MKKALRQEFYEQMHTILPDLYQKAYALKGNKIEAEMLTENILLRGAKQFSALANKARFRDILLQKIETGTHMDLEATDLDALAARVMEKIEKKDNIKKMVWGVCAGVLSVGIFVTVIIPNFPSNIPDEQTTPEATTAKDVNGEIINPTLPVIGEVTMKDTKTIKGDNKVIFFENYHAKMMFCAKDSVVHMILQANYGVKYYRIEEDGTVASKTLFAGSILGESEYICNRNSGAGGIAVDENGVAHVIATHCIKKTENNPYHLVHYQITSDLTIEKETLPKLYYTDTHTYDPLCMGVFMSDDNEIYYIEKYKEFGVDSMYVLAIGKLNVDGAFSYVDTLELPNEITRGGSRLFNSILTFYSDNNIYYCVIKE